MVRTTVDCARRYSTVICIRRRAVNRLGRQPPPDAPAFFYTPYCGFRLLPIIQQPASTEGYQMFAVSTRMRRNKDPHRGRTIRSTAGYATSNIRIGPCETATARRSPVESNATAVRSRGSPVDATVDNTSAGRPPPDSSAMQTWEHAGTPPNIQAARPLAETATAERPGVAGDTVLTCVVAEVPHEQARPSLPPGQVPSIGAKSDEPRRRLAIRIRSRPKDVAGITRKKMERVVLRPDREIFSSRAELDSFNGDGPIPFKDSLPGREVDGCKERLVRLRAHSFEREPLALSAQNHPLRPEIGFNNKRCGGRSRGFP